MRGRIILWAVSSATLLIEVSAGGDCLPNWVQTFGSTGSVNSDVQALVEFDDGSGNGPALYAAGSFTMAGATTAKYIAKWAAGSWSPLASGFNSQVHALVVFDDGLGGGPALYAAGSFTMAGGMPTAGIAKWDGKVWTPLGSGIIGEVNALAVFDDGSGDRPALIAGGYFSTAGDVQARRVARWDGCSWSALGAGVHGNVRALAMFDDGTSEGPALYAGGTIITQFSPAGHIARWNGASWLPLGIGLASSVFALTVFDDGSGTGPALYAGGHFQSAGGSPASRIAKWDGAAWSGLGAGLNATVRTLEVFDDGTGDGPSLFAGGFFYLAGGIPAQGIAQWNGREWSAVGGEITGGFVQELLAVDNRKSGGRALFVGGFLFEEQSGDEYLLKLQGCPAPPVDLADLNGDGVVDGADLEILLVQWSTDGTADLNNDEQVNGIDLGILLASWTLR